MDHIFLFMNTVKCMFFIGLRHLSENCAFLLGHDLLYAFKLMDFAFQIKKVLLHWVLLFYCNNL
jgi:hypothetical protein